jgi:DNA polymerase (family 10)
MAAAAQRLGYEYLAITDHSASHGFGDGVDPDRLLQRVEEIREFNRRSDGIRLLAGSEVNIHSDGTLDYEDEVLAELDWVIASIHTGFSRSASATTARMIAAIEHPEVDCIGHATGRLLTVRDPYPIDIEATFEAAARSGTAFEINGSPKRRDLSDIHARMAREAGVKIVLNTDAHRTGSLDNMRYAVATARRAWLEPGDILNTGPWWK